MDTGPLADLALHELRLLPIDKLRYFNTDVAMERLRTYLTAAQSLATTPHVLTEVERHIKQATSNSSTLRVRQEWYGLLSRMRVSEREVAYHDADSALVAKFGLCDGALVAIARRDDITLFTAEVPLNALARSQGLRVVSDWEVVQALEPQ